MQLGYCPENKLQNARCKGRIITKDEALAVLRERGAPKMKTRDIIGNGKLGELTLSGGMREAAPPSDSEFEEE